MSYANHTPKYDPYANVPAPQRALSSTRLPESVQRAKPSRSERDVSDYIDADGEEEYKPISGVPPHINGFLKEIKRFRTANKTPRWNECDTVAYLRPIRKLTEEQTTECLFLLRERNDFRPSVKAVKAVADELLWKGNCLPDPDMEGKQTDAYRPFTLPEPERAQIAGRTTDDAIKSARAAMPWNRNRPAEEARDVPAEENRGTQNKTPQRQADPNHAEKVRRQLADMRRECEAQGVL